MLRKAIKREVIYLYNQLKLTFTDEQSDFSSKRIERMLLFTTAIIASNVWFWNKYPLLEIGEIISYVSIHLGFAGYTMITTERGKKNRMESKKNKEENE